MARVSRARDNVHTWPQPARLVAGPCHGPCRPGLNGRGGRGAGERRGKSASANTTRDHRVGGCREGVRRPRHRQRRSAAA